MKQIIPSWREMGVLAVLAVVCALVVQAGPTMDLQAAALSIPLFIAAAVMGLRRHWRKMEMEMVGVDVAEKTELN